MVEVIYKSKLRKFDNIFDAITFCVDYGIDPDQFIRTVLKIEGIMITWRRQRAAFLVGANYRIQHRLPRLTAFAIALGFQTHKEVI